tara:strand:- start:1836 stop:2378 length:543 start_codon:yes stop_codon:yes gene_type:complete
MERQNVKISINELSSIDKFKKYKNEALEKNIIKFEKNLEEFKNINNHINNDLLKIQHVLHNINNVDASLDASVNTPVKDDPPTKRYDIYADVYVSDILCEFLNIPSGALYIKNDIIIAVYEYIKTARLIHFGGFFLVDLKLQNIFPQNGDYYAKRDKFLKITNIYSMLARHFTKKTHSYQ